MGRPSEVNRKLRVRSDEIRVAEERRRQIKQEQERHNRLVYERNQDLIEKFLEITERKVSVLDDYGEEDWGKLTDEIATCLRKILKREGKDDNDIRRFLKHRNSYQDKDWSAYTWLFGELDSRFRGYHKLKSRQSSRSRLNVNDLSGVEFENDVANILKDNGYEDVRGTPPTGDQGADLIAKRLGKAAANATRQQTAISNTTGSVAVSGPSGITDGTDGSESFLILSCMDRDEAFAVPYSWLQKNKKNFNMTDRGERSYWHVPVTTLDNGSLGINMSKVGRKAALDPYRFEFRTDVTNQ